MKARMSVSRVDMKIFDSPASTILVTNSAGARYDIAQPLVLKTCADPGWIPLRPKESNWCATPHPGANCHCGALEFRHCTETRRGGTHEFPARCNYCGVAGVQPVCARASSSAMSSEADTTCQNRTGLRSYKEGRSMAWGTARNDPCSSS